MDEPDQNAESGLLREAALFQAAAQLTGPDRAAFLDRACGEDKALRARLEALLVAHDVRDSFLEPAEPRPDNQPAGTIKVELSDTPDEAVGTTIGRYKLREKVGEGGCGVVYVAEQTEPVRRRVALKVIKLGMDTKQVVARFEAERQALAMMDHPNIAKVLDAGTTNPHPASGHPLPSDGRGAGGEGARYLPSGRPYFVMELVRGIKITDYCDQNNLPTKERLELFIQVCHAIQHAHQKGIIHRDIKPSNILVTLHDGEPVPKVIDFGIAKATEGRLTDATIYTQLQQFIGTPAYMSPEQAEMSGLDIDTRSDIYSLGVLLYELLTGKTPLDAQELVSQGIDVMRKTIREKAPPRPSLRLATLQGDDLTTTAKRRSVEVPKLIHLLKGDLDWIVMKCLEKDRTRRYETANGLAMDLKRHLNMEPVVARPPSKWYEFQRTVRRHKFGFAATAAIIVVLAVGIVMTTWQAVRATRARAGESVQRQKAEANEKEALAAREQAQTQELIARQRAYASDMNVAMQALDDNNLGQALDLLNRQRPQPGQKDLRGWEWRYLWQQTRSDALFTLCQESNEVESLTASADSRWLAVGLLHNEGLFVYDLQTRQQVANLAPGESYVRAAFSPAQPLLAFAGTVISFSWEEQTTLHLWNATTRQMVGEFPLDHPCAGLAFSQDGRTLVTSTEAGRVTLWRVSDGTKLTSYPVTYQLNDTAGTGFAVTPDLNLAAYSYGSFNSRRVRVIDLRDGKELWTTAAPKRVITTLAFSPDGKVLATAASFNESDIHLWDTTTGKEIGVLKGHSSWVSSLVFWPDGKKLASSSADQTIRIWDLASRKCLDVLHGHRQEVWRLALLPDGKTLVSGAKDGTVRFWDASVTHPRSPHITVSEDVVDWRFTPDSQSVLTLDQQGQVTRWSGPEFRQQERLLDVGTNFISHPWNNVFSQDGRFLAFGSINGVIQVWDVSGRVLWRQWTNTTDFVWPATFLANGNKLLTSSMAGNLNHEWDLRTGRELQSWQAVPFLNDIVAFGDEERYVEFGGHGVVRFRSAAKNEVMETNLDYLEGTVPAVSPDGTLFAVASGLGFARVWNTANWQERTLVPGFPHSCDSAAFSPDGERLVVVGGTGLIRLWDTESWQDVFTLRGDGSWFFSTKFSPDGNVIGIMSREGSLQLWRAPSWAEIHAAEAKDPPSLGYGATGKIEGQKQ